MRRPLLGPVLGFAAGIVAASEFAPPLAVCLLVAVAALLGLLLAQVRCSPDRVFLSAAVLASAALGSVALRIPATLVPADSLQCLTPDAPVLGRVRGELSDVPELRLTEQRGQLTARTALRLKLSSWRPGNGPWQTAAGVVLLSLRAPLPPGVFPGQTLEATGVLRPVEAPAAPGLFDYAEFLRRQDIHRILTVESLADLQHPDSPGPVPWSERFLPWAHTTLARGLPDDESARLLRAMTLGWKTPLNGAVDDVFMRAGTMHVFAISGLHIALIMAMLVELGRALRLSRNLAGGLALPLIWAYVAATGWQPSAIRSGVMASLVFGSGLLQRPGDLLNSLAAAAGILLVWDPAQLLQSGFQLSFGAVAGLALLVPPVERLLLSWVQFDPWIPEPLRPRWQQWLGPPLRLLALNLSVGLAATVATLPLTIHHFNLVSPVSLLANLVVVPLSSLALAAGSASLAVAPAWPWLSELFNASGWVSMNGMIRLSRWFASWPGGWWAVAAPPWYWWLGWYAALIGGGLTIRWDPDPTARKPATHCRWLWAATSALALWGLFAVGAWWSYRSTPRLFIFRDDPAVFATSPAGNALFDGGRTGAGHRTIIPFLRAQGVNHLDAHHVSLGLQRFCGLGPELVTELTPRVVLLPAASQARQPLLRRYVAHLTAAGIPQTAAPLGTRHGAWTVVGPSPDSSVTGRATDHAPVWKAEFAGVHVLYVGAASRAVLSDLQRRPDAARADILIAAAHEAAARNRIDSEPLPDDLLKLVRPQLAVLITAPFPAAAHISRDTRERLRRASCPVLLTDESGGVQLEFRDGRFRQQTYGGAGRRETAPTAEAAPAPPAASPASSQVEDPVPEVELLPDPGSRD